MDNIPKNQREKLKWAEQFVSEQKAILDAGGASDAWSMDKPEFLKHLPGSVQALLHDIDELSPTILDHAMERIHDMIEQLDRIAEAAERKDTASKFSAENFDLRDIESANNPTYVSGTARRPLSEKELKVSERKLKRLMQKYRKRA